MFFSNTRHDTRGKQVGRPDQTDKEKKEKGASIASWRPISQSFKKNED